VPLSDDDDRRRRLGRIGALSDGTQDGQVLALAHGVPCTEDGFNVASSP